MKDKNGNELEVGDSVVYPGAGLLEISKLRYNYESIDDWNDVEHVEDYVEFKGQYFIAPARCVVKTIPYKPVSL